MINNIVDAEPIGSNKPFDILIIATCTGNIVLKLASVNTDVLVLMAEKAHLRSLLSLVIAISANDGRMNIPAHRTFFQTKYVYFVLFGQGNLINKKNFQLQELMK